MSKSHRKKKRATPHTPHPNKTAPTIKSLEDLLKDMPAYRQNQRLLLFASVACLLSISLSFLLRVNLPSLGTVALFFNMLAYLLLGAVGFIWLRRIRPLRKKAKMLEREQEQQAAQTEAQSILSEIAEGNPQHMAKSGSDAQTPGLNQKPNLATHVGNALSGNSPHSKLPKSSEYLRYRMIWRLLLIGAGLIIITAYMIYSSQSGPAPLPLVILIMAYIPLGAAIFIYSRKLKPLKREWEEINLSSKAKKAKPGHQNIDG
jgi:hypothetical protein